MIALYLQGNGQKANPVCLLENYREDVLDSFPNIRNLDGNRKGFALADPGDLSAYEVDTSQFK